MRNQVTDLVADSRWRPDNMQMRAGVNKTRASGWMGGWASEQLPEDRLSSLHWTRRLPVCKMAVAIFLSSLLWPHSRRPNATQADTRSVILGLGQVDSVQPYCTAVAAFDKRVNKATLMASLAFMVDVHCCYGRRLIKRLLEFNATLEAPNGNALDRGRRLGELKLVLLAWQVR